MPRIITVTPNTAIDHVIRVEHLQPGAVLQAGRSRQYPAGKGVNVARTVASLGLAATVTGVVGAASAWLFDTLQSDFIRTSFVQVPGETRTNISIAETAGTSVTHIRTPGYRVRDEDMEHLAGALRDIIETGDIVVLAGSLPDGAEVSLYAILADLCDQAGARVILDTSGPALAAGIAGRPYMIKPNLAELGDLVGRELREPDERVVQAVLEKLELAASLVVVSRGAEGILVKQPGHQGLRKATLRLSPGKNIANNVGCGDALVGGFAAGFAQKYSLDETIRLGVACGTANLFTEVPGQCDPETVRRYMAEVELSEDI